MSGAAIDLNASELESVIERLEGLVDLLLADRPTLMESIGAEGETQTRRRLRSEKTAPDGTAWPEWSTRYAATRHGGHSLLMGEGHLEDDITFDAHADGVTWGANLVYAAVHQAGADFSTIKGRRHVKIPARPYLGLSSENEADMQAVVDDWTQNVMARA
ncbi:MAG: phage virion morphogenesis protein [Desulfovibrionaceae bacterium]